MWEGSVYLRVNMERSVLGEVWPKTDFLLNQSLVCNIVESYTSHHLSSVQLNFQPSWVNPDVIS